MKICLVPLPIRDETLSHPNLGFLQLSSALRSTAHSVCWVDLVKLNMSPEEAAFKIAQQNPDVIGISGMVVSYYYLEPLVRKLKSITRAPVILGGNIAASALDIIEKHTEVDFCFIGESERTFPRFLDRIETAKTAPVIEDIPGITWRDKRGSFVKTPGQDVPPNIDEFGFPDYDAIDMEYYILSYSRQYRDQFERLTNSPGESCRAFPMLTSRGCPFNCAFCFRLIKNIRMHGVEFVIEHIKVLKTRYGINLISIPDELIVSNRKHALTLLKSMSKENMGVHFITGGVRSDMVDKELLDAFRAANFIMICLGVESGSQRMLDIMNKKTTVKDNMNAIQWVLESGLSLYFNLVMGAPGENEATVKETEHLLEKAFNLGFDLNNYTTYLACPFPGTKFYDYAVNEGLIPDKHRYLLNLRGQSQYPINLSAFKNREKLISKVTQMNSRIKKLGQKKSIFRNIPFFRKPRIIST